VHQYNKAVSENLQELPKLWSVYALCCKGGALYIGVTNNIEKRIKAHTEGTGSRFVWAHRPFRLLTVISCLSKRDAMSLEYRLKKLRKPQKLRELGLDESLINEVTT
jgi:putative endonuclease